MTPKLIEDLGMKYITETSKWKARFGLYECQYCGKEFEANVNKVKRGDSKSCGCRRRGVTHGLKHHRFYGIWGTLIQRCNNSKYKNYKNYGARGIKVCDEWLDVKNFIIWCEATHPNIEGVSLDRIDNDGGQSPDNCRWVDRLTQSTNQRVRRDNKSGYKGIFSVTSGNSWVAQLTYYKKIIYLGSFKTIEEAIFARDQYIIKHNLPHKLSTQY